MQEEQMQSNCEGEQPNSGGAAPAERRCRYTKANGELCRDWAVRGRECCHRHDRFLHAPAGRPIDVPLLENEASVILLLSETLRSLAWGTIPVSNGRTMIDGCRLAHTIHAKRLETAKFRLSLRRQGIPEHEIFDAPASPDPVPMPGSEADPEPAALSSEPSALSSEPAAVPAVQPNPRVRFRDLKKNWDKEMLRAENQMMDMRFPRAGETRGEFNEARLTPFENLAKEETIPVAIP